MSERATETPEERRLRIQEVAKRIAEANREILKRLSRRAA